ncbi:hypothetical protein TSUD_258280 [Trifolium subterraneum]|uniref:EF-hand domain-containing protein n=1 Tax=Trifolium subterraneum TaxID=3900 RepID=A0A2Z6NVP3_TRISU|nr:hypothetical protein TSUD_258280 [Trifolium subterraneum]
MVNGYTVSVATCTAVATLEVSPLSCLCTTTAASAITVHLRKRKKKSSKVNGYTGGVAIDLEVATLPVSPLGSPHCRGISAKIEGRDSRFEGNVYKHGQTWTKVVPSHMRFKVCLQRLGSKLTEAEVRQLMEAADVEGNGTVDYIEFNTATMHRHWLERDEQSVALSRCLIFYCNIPSSAVK